MRDSRATLHFALTLQAKRRKAVLVPVAVDLRCKRNYGDSELLEPRVRQDHSRAEYSRISIEARVQLPREDAVEVHLPLAMDSLQNLHLEPGAHRPDSQQAQGMVDMEADSQPLQQLAAHPEALLQTLDTVYGGAQE